MLLEAEVAHLQTVTRLGTTRLGTELDRVWNRRIIECMYTLLRTGNVSGSLAEKTIEEIIIQTLAKNKKEIISQRQQAQENIKSELKRLKGKLIPKGIAKKLTDMFVKEISKKEGALYKKIKQEIEKHDSSKK